MSTADLSKQLLQTRGRAGSGEPSLLAPTPETSLARASIESSPSTAGAARATSNPGTLCVRCGTRQARVNPKTGLPLQHGLCRRCTGHKPCPVCGKPILPGSTRCSACHGRDVVAVAQRARAIMSVCPRCNGKKNARSAVCMGCHRSLLAERNVRDAGVMARARQQVALAGNSKQRRSSAECAASELLDALGIPYLVEQRVDRYVVDFVVPRANLAIEVNGRYWHGRPEQQKRDARKRGEIEALGMILVVLWSDQPQLWALQLFDALGLVLPSLSMTSP